MKNRKLKLAVVAATALTAAACHTTPKTDAQVTDPTSDSQVTVKKMQTAVPVRGGSPRYLPKAVIYKTNGVYNDHVAISLNADGTAPLSFPGPGDVSADSAPLVMDGGWLLDRRGGVGLNTAFLRWTYDEYHRLPQVPDVAQLMANIIPGARVTAVHRLDMTASQARNDTAAVNAAIRALDSDNQTH